MDETISELKAILDHYDLGELVGYNRDTRGTVNTSFTIEMEKDGRRNKYFLRRYKSWIKVEELHFEHSLITHLVSNNFNIVARVVPTLQGGTFIHRVEEGGDPSGAYYAIFDFLTGEDRYTWVAPACQESEIISSASVLANFHRLMADFVPGGIRLEPRILELLPVIDANLVDCSSVSRGTVFEQYLQEHFALMRDHLRQTRSEVERYRNTSLIELVIHCDFHPGNLKYAGGQAVGLFDFDWSKVEYRVFDVALGLFYFFVDWRGNRDGELRLEDANLFLKTYQGVLSESPYPGLLSASELEALPVMLSAANLYVLNWTVLDYIRKEVDPDEYLVYLKHGVNTIYWLEETINQAGLRKMLSDL